MKLCDYKASYFIPRIKNLEYNETRLINIFKEVHYYDYPEELNG